jgi:hypothetical protein
MVVLLLLILVGPSAGIAAAFTRRQSLRLHAKMALLSVGLGLVPLILAFGIIAGTVGMAGAGRDTFITVGLFDFLSVFAFWSAIFILRNVAKRRAETLRAVITELRSNGLVTSTEISRALNDRRILTPRGGVWHGASVKRLLARLDEADAEGTRQYKRKRRRPAVSGERRS